MSTEENKAVIRRLIDAWNTNELGALDDLVAPHHVERWWSRVRQTDSGPAWTAQILAGARAMYPDLHCTIDDLLADGDRVIMRMTTTGTRTGKEFKVGHHGRTDGQEDSLYVHRHLPHCGWQDRGRLVGRG
jgi:predicted ester cyclase